MQGSYNGVVFEICRIESFRTAPVLSRDGSSFVCWHKVIQAICQLNVGATARYKFAGANVAGQGPDASTPPMTYLEMLNRLAVHRKRLVIWMDSGPDGARKQVLIDSPPKAANGTTLPSDALYGPQCRVAWVVPDGANKSLTMGMEFHTWVAAAKNDQYPRYVLDHRWTFQVTNDQDYYAAHLITGNVQLNVGLMQHHKILPDSFRRTLFHPIPDGFQRVTAEPTFYPDGSGFDYTIVDVEKATNFPMGAKYGITRITVEQTKEHILNW